MRLVSTHVLIFLVVGLISACATQRSTVEAPSASTPSSSSDTVVVPDATNQEATDSVSAKTEETQSPPQFPLQRDLYVWIESQAFDAFAALGFLQELERAGIRPKKIVASGFGCYIAAAWGLEANANSAEWQSMKWSDFNLFNSKSLLGKISGRDGMQEQFRKEFLRLFPAREFSDLKDRVDCPVYNRQMGFRLHSSRLAKLDLAESNWVQLQTPLIFQSEPEFLRHETWMSGVVGSLPSGVELDFMSPAAEASTGGGDWLILRTSRGLERAGNGVWDQAMASRLDGIRSYGGLTPASRSFRSIELFDSKRQSSDTLKPGMRRVFLLEGRRRAQLLLQTGDWKNFLSGDLPK